MKNNGITKVMEVWEVHNKILKPVKKELYLEIIDQIANLFAAGSFYYYIFNFDTLKMEVVHEGIRTVLGIEPDHLSLEKLLNIMHPEDIEKMHKKEEIAVNFLLNTIPREELLHYKVVYLMRLKHADGTYKTILHQAKTLVVSDEGKIQQVLGIHTDISYLNIPFDHKISFISDKGPSYHVEEAGKEIKFIENDSKDKLSIREIEIIKKLSEGNNFNEIAALLFVSPHTINTHKKNILKKIGCKNSTELVARCIREGVI
jgi:DNA-binding CsgD family transcriptional regulator